MKKIISLISVFFLLLFSSCDKSNNLKYLSGYWEIKSVSKDNSKIKNYPFSGTIDYFILDRNYESGFRKKVKPRIDGVFDITMHEIGFNIDIKKKHIIKILNLEISLSNSLNLVYGKGKNFSETIVKIDSTDLIIENSDGYSYEYKRFYPKDYLNE